MPYIGRSSDFGVRTRYNFTASGGETSLTGSDDNGKTLAFTDGAYTDVYLNGVLLVQGDDYSLGANTITGLTALSASDVVEVISYDVFNVVDTVPASTGGEFFGGIEADRYQNADSFSEDFTVGANKNALLVGPVTLTGTVTVNGTLTVV
jgi:hypothetical protein